MHKRIMEFITSEVWRIQRNNLSQFKSYLITQLRILLLVGRGFQEDKCQLRASALTYYTMLSVVPLCAMLFGIAKGFGFQAMLKKRLIERFPGQEEFVIKIIAFAQSLIENTGGGILAGIGIITLFWTVIKVLSNIENSFNEVWGVEEPRSWGRKFSDYLSVMLVCPILFIMSSSIMVFIVTQVNVVIEKLSLSGPAGSLMLFCVKLLPYCMVWILFTFVYIFMPHTKVRFTSGLIAGIIAGTIYELVQWVYITFQIGVSKYNAIYGGFAALPLFLIWLRLSWLIVLLGAEFSFAHQNVHRYEYEPDCARASLSLKKLLSLRIMQLLVRTFSAEGNPHTVTSISQTLEIPYRLTRTLIKDLTECNLIVKTLQHETDEPSYQPAHAIETLTIKHVLDALEHRGIERIPVKHSPELTTLSESLHTFADLIEHSPANKCIKDIA